MLLLCRLEVSKNPNQMSAKIVPKGLKVSPLAADELENQYCSIRVPTDPSFSGMFDTINILKKIYFGQPTTPNSWISKIQSKYWNTFGTVHEHFWDSLWTLLEQLVESLQSVFQLSKSVHGLSLKCSWTVPTVHQLSFNCLPTVHRVSSNCLPTVHRLS